jgi:hypothetical protein
LRPATHDDTLPPAVRPFRDDRPTPDRVRAALEAALHVAPADLAAAFGAAEAWRERALARVPCPSRLRPLARRAWQRASERVIAERPRIETATAIACPLWVCAAEDDIEDTWSLVWCLLGQTEAVASIWTASEPQALAVLAEARFSVAHVASLVLSQSYAPGIPSVERFEPFAVVRHTIARVDGVPSVQEVQLTAPPDRRVGPWARDAEAAFDASVLAQQDRERLDETLARMRG